MGCLGKFRPPTDPTPNTPKAAVQPLAPTPPLDTRPKILDLASLLARRAQWRLAGRRVVFTNGCFDLLHLGHVDYLEAARALGGALVVGLNTDDSVRRLKGPTRPLNPEAARARVLAALLCVDAVCLFAHDTPLELITALRPDVLVKGADYALEQIVGAREVLAWGGQVHTLAFIEGYSTTRLVQKAAGQP